MPALDGLRGVGVGAVIAYHGGLSWAGGGFLGVDAFFVVSGYLITRLLLDEHKRCGGISLAGFWARRARRLLPALVVMIVGVTLASRWNALGEDVARLRTDALAALGEVANWRLLLSDQSYFGRSAAMSPLRHTWSLAIEEQFYLLWPLALVPLVKIGRRWLVLLVAIVGAAASAAAMYLIGDPSGDPSRAYYGTDTRAQALLVGAALAAFGPLVICRRSLATRVTTFVLATVSAVFLLWAIIGLDGQSPFLYRGGFLLVAVAVAAVVVCAVELPRTVVGRVLAWKPLQAIGRGSYSAYLWHWPVFVFLTAQRTGLSGLSLLAARLAVTVLISFCSYRLVEQPIRRTPGLARPARVVGVGAPAFAIATAVVLLATAVPVAQPASARPNLTVAQSDPAPIRVLLEGDSLAMTLGLGLGTVARRLGVVLEDRGTLGCGIAGSARLRVGGRVGPPTAVCDTWTEKWRADIAQTNPAVIAVLVGRWEVMDRWVRGHWTHIGDPAVDASLDRALETAVNVAATSGRRIAFLTTPTFQGVERPNGGRYAEDDPQRVARFNTLVRAVAARHTRQAAVIDLAAVLTPGGAYVSHIGELTVRQDDGVHVTIAGGAFVAPAILPVIRQLATNP